LSNGFTIYLTTPAESSHYGRIDLFPAITQFRDPEDFLSHTYPPNVPENISNDPSFFRNRSILIFRNETVTSINVQCINRMQGELSEYLSIDTIDEEVSEPLTVELFNHLTHQPCPHQDFI